MGNKLLESWSALNAGLKDLTSEDDAFALLQEELKTHKRITFVLRIHARYNVLRGGRERLELSEAVKGAVA